MVVRSLSELPAPTLVLLGFLVLERAAELLISRAHLSETKGPAAGGTLEWCAMIALHAALLAAPPLEAVLTGSRPPSWLMAVSIVTIVLAQALRYWSIASLGRAWNARARVDSSHPAVVLGPYRWIRHPNYLAVIAEFCAIPIAFGAWRAWLALNLLHVPLIARRIRNEERLLRAVPGYTAGMSRKGRFIPRLGRRSSV